MAQLALGSLVVVADVGDQLFHVGDEAMLAANLDALRRADAAVGLTVVGRNGARIARRYGVAGLTAPDAYGPADPLPTDLAEALAGADGLFISGGGNLSGTWPGLLGLRIGLMAEAQRLGVPVVLGGQTIGPDLPPWARRPLAETLASADHVGVRELMSARLAVELGVGPERLSYQVDDAFFLPGQAVPLDATSRHEPFLAVTLDESFLVPSARGGLASIAAQLARFAVDSGLTIMFLPHVGALPSGTAGTTAPARDHGDGAAQLGDGAVGRVLGEVATEAGARAIVLPVQGAAQTAWLTRQADIVFSSRYHPLVFASAAGVPCLAVHRDAYSEAKVVGALAHVGGERWSLNAADAEEGAALAVLRRLWAGREEVRGSALEAVAAIEQREQRRWSVLLGRLGAGTGDLGSLDEGTLPLDVTPPSPPMEAPGAEDWGARRRRRSIVEQDTVLTEDHWAAYARDGFVRLGRVLEDAELQVLRQRTDDLASGALRNPAVQLQLDTGGAYEELPEVVSSLDGATSRYRKVQGLELDDRFSALVRYPLFLEICAHEYGPHAAVSTFRAMVMNKPARQGTVLPWHQDGGDVWALDRDPLVTVWVAIDPATRDNGCVEVLPGSHRLGLLTTFGSTVSPADVERYCPEEDVLALEVEAGHAVLMHNWLIHRSGVNPSAAPRRAFTACYLDARTRSTLTGETFPVVAGELPSAAPPFLRGLRDEAEALRESAARAEEYASSLRVEAEVLRDGAARSAEYASSLRDANRVLEESLAEATAYARSLEAEVDKLREALVRDEPDEQPGTPLGPSLVNLAVDARSRLRNLRGARGGGRT